MRTPEVLLCNPLDSLPLVLVPFLEGRLTPFFLKRLSGVLTLTK